VDVVNGGWCTQCMLNSVHAVLSVNSWSSHGEIVKDDLILCSVMIVEWRMKMSAGGWRYEWYGGYKQIWEIRGSTCQIGCRRSRICDITPFNGTRVCRFGDRKVTCTCNFLKSQVLMKVSHISSHLFHSCPQLYHHLRTRSNVMPLYLSKPWLWANTKYSIHRVH